MVPFSDPPVTCTFTGQGMMAWNAATGAQLPGGGGHSGGASSQASIIRPDLTPWRNRPFEFRRPDTDPPPDHV
jgi:hypothetical protein